MQKSSKKPIIEQHVAALRIDLYGLPTKVDDALRNGTLVNLGRWCSNLTPPPQRSTSSQMVVKFRSDQAINGNGFAANWTSG